ncbi:MAG: DNA polymerase III subunit delta [Fuerstiella sp.]|nr:DNA polymerase III subunit delta [Fuerstiella sp.]
MHATEFLASESGAPVVPVMVLFGSERSLKIDVLHRVPGCQASGDDDSDLSFSRVTGDEAQLTDVTDELLTVSMFGDRRVVMVEDADGFVKDNRGGLEKYVASPARSSLLILDVKSWPKNTRLAKSLSKSGLAVECNPLHGLALVRWLQHTANDQFAKTLDRDTAALMVALAGDRPGVLQQEIAKLASLAGDADRISSEDVRQAVGDWRTQTTWVMLDAVRDGNVAEAIQNLDSLVSAGEPVQKIMGGVTFVFRKFAEATERARQTRDVRGALTAAGVFPSAVGPAEAYLRRIGFHQASRILQLLSDTDANLKGGSRIDLHRQLEELLVRLSGTPQTN